MFVKRIEPSITGVSHSRRAIIIIIEEIFPISLFISILTVPHLKLPFLPADCVFLPADSKGGGGNPHLK